MQLQPRKGTCGGWACSAQVPMPKMSRQLLGRGGGLSAPLTAPDHHGPSLLAFSGGLLKEHFFSKGEGAESLCSISAGLGVAQMSTHPDTHLPTCFGCLFQCSGGCMPCFPQFYTHIFLLVLTDPPKGHEKFRRIHSSPPPLTLPMLSLRPPSTQSCFSSAQGREKCALYKL